MGGKNIKSKPFKETIITPNFSKIQKIDLKGDRETIEKADSKENEVSDVKMHL